MTSIPYSLRRHPETGLNNGQLGMGLFLASEVMFFGGLFAGYILLRTGHPDWPRSADFLHLPIATINTVVLLLSSVTMALTVRWAGRGEHRRRHVWAWLATQHLGLVFVAVKLFEYHQKIEHGDLPSTNNLLAVYFALTGVHLVHLVAGIVANIVVTAPVLVGRPGHPERYRHRVAMAGLYWYFVDAMWLVIYVALYWI